MKKITVFLIFLLLLSYPLALWHTAFALLTVDPSEKIHDFADLLEENQREALAELAEKIIAKHELDIVIVTINDDEGYTSRDYADNFYDMNGFGLGEDCDGLLLLLNMKARMIYISTCGLGITYFNDARIENLLDNIYDYMMIPDYYTACRVFIENVDAHLTRYLTEASEPSQPSQQKEVIHYIQQPTGYSPSPHDSYISYVEPRSTSEKFALSALAGSVVGCIIMGIMAYAHKQSLGETVELQHYLQDKPKVTKTVDRFLHSHTSHTAKPKPSDNNNSTFSNDSSSTSTHTSSGEQTHGGGGRSF